MGGILRWTTVVTGIVTTVAAMINHAFQFGMPDSIRTRARRVEATIVIGLGMVMAIAAVFRVPLAWYAAVLFAAHNIIEVLVESFPTAANRQGKASLGVVLVWFLFNSLFLIALLSDGGRRGLGL